MRSKRKGKRKAPVRIARPLGEALDRAAPRGRRLLAVFNRWRAMVSQQTLQHARPTSIRRDVLYLTVTDPLWMSELTYFVPGFLDAFNQALPSGQPLKSIRLRVGPLKNLPDERGESRPEPPTPDTSPIPPELQSRLEKIADPDLRDQMVRIAAQLVPKEGKKRVR